MFNALLKADDRGYFIEVDGKTYKADRFVVKTSYDCLYISLFKYNCVTEEFDFLIEFPVDEFHAL